MKLIFSILIMALFSACPALYSQTVIAGGPASGAVTLIPFIPNSCFSNGSTNAVACGSPVTFNFTSFQISSCPNSGKIPAPGSVAYGGPGSSASFSFYHTLSYSPSNEHQQLVFNAPINTFQFSVSGPASGNGEVFSVQTYNGAVQNGNHTFNTPGPGSNLTYTISGANFTRVQFTEINAISADDELFGDFFVSGPGCPLPLNGLSLAAEATAPYTVQLDWESQDENGLEHLAVERSSDGQTWTELHRAAPSNTAGTHTYTWRDAAAPMGRNFYRIAAHDLDGSTAHSNTVQVELQDPNQLDFALWPNPAQNQVQLDFRGLEGSKHVALLNTLGQVVRAQETKTAGKFTLDLTGVEAAVYLVQVRYAGQVRSQRLMVQ